MPRTYTEHPDAASFLAAARATLDREESANSLMLGVCLRLVDEPGFYGSQPYLATVKSAGRLRAAALMTPPYRLQLWAGHKPDLAALRLMIEALLQSSWTVPGVLARQGTAEAFATAWCERRGVAWSAGQRIRAYELRRVDHPRYPAGGLRQAGAGETELVRQWASGFHDDCFHDLQQARSVRNAERLLDDGRLYFWVDGVPRSMAARLRPTPHGETVSYVYTPADQRRQGYAAAAVARLSQLILDEGKRFCTLYADLANPTSNSIYQRIGYRAVADVVELDFSERQHSPGAPG